MTIISLNTIFLNVYYKNLFLLNEIILLYFILKSCFASSIISIFSSPLYLVPLTTYSYISSSVTPSY